MRWGETCLEAGRPQSIAGQRHRRCGLWPPFEKAVRDLAAQAPERVEARENSGEQKSPPSPFDRLQRLTDAMSRLAAALKGVADAGTPLYQSLSDAQHRRFRLLAHMLRPHWMGGGLWQHPQFGNPPGRGPGGDMEQDGSQNGMMGPDSDEDDSDNL
jgi:hypothetical protein